MTNRAKIELSIVSSVNCISQAVLHTKLHLEVIIISYVSLINTHVLTAPVRALEYVRQSILQPCSRLSHSLNERQCTVLYPEDRTRIKRKREKKNASAKLEKTYYTSRHDQTQQNRRTETHSTTRNTWTTRLQFYFILFLV